MTDTPTRAEVEALALWFKRDGDQKAADALTALLPLAYTETGETWRDRATRLDSEFFQFRDKAWVIDTELRAENARLRKELRFLMQGGDVQCEVPKWISDFAKAALSPQEGRED